MSSEPVSPGVTGGEIACRQHIRLHGTHPFSGRHSMAGVVVNFRGVGVTLRSFYLEEHAFPV